MAKRIRGAPGTSENKDFRANEYFNSDIEAILKLVGSRTVDAGSMISGGIATFTVTVNGARPDAGQTVQVGVPSTFDQGLIPWGYVSANDTVTVILYNRTSTSIDPGSMTYHVRVMP